MRKKTITVAVLTLCFALLLGGCAAEPEEKTVNYVSPSEIFYSDAEMQSFRPDIVKTLLTLCTDMEGEERFSLGDGRYAGLIDLDVDGVPEIVEGYAGGSAGNTWFQVYDIATGNLVGNFNSGYYGDFEYGYIANYQNTDGTFTTFALYENNMGAATREDMIFELIYDGAKKTFVETERFYASVTASIGDETKTEEAVYRADGKAVSFASYASAYAKFNTGYIKMQDTVCVILRWVDIEAASDEELAGKMADALLSSGQKFINPKKIVKE